MITKKTIVVQYKSVYSEGEWRDSGNSYNASEDNSIKKAREYAEWLKSVNPNVRIIERTISEYEFS